MSPGLKRTGLVVMVFPHSRIRRVLRMIIGAGAAVAVAVPTSAPAANALPFDMDQRLGGLTSSAPAFEMPQIPGLAGFSVPTSTDLREMGEDAAWQIRQDLHRGADRLPGDAGRTIKRAIDDAIEVAYPGIIARREAPQPAPAPVNNPQPETQPRPAPNPCPPTAKACVDLDHQVSWLQDGNGNRVGNIVNISGGAKDWATPAGIHYVNRKVKAEISREFSNAPMPNAVYFTTNGVAFHAGNTEQLSHGCVHLSLPDSERYFNHLGIGDQVYVWGSIDYGVPNGPVRR